AMSLVEVDGLVQSVKDAGEFFVWEQAGEGETGVIVDGDMEGLDAGATVAQSPVAGGADSRLREAAQLLDVEVKELVGVGAFVTLDRWFGRFEGREAIKVMTAQDARERGFGDGQDRHDLGVRAALAAQGEDPGFELGSSFAWLVMRNRRAVGQA